MPPSNTNMSMTGLNDTSPTCSSSTPNDPPDADPEIPTSNDANPDTRTAKQPTFPRFLVVESADPQKKLRDLNDVIMDTTIRGVTSASVSIEWMGPALLVEVSHEAYARNLQRMTQIDQFHVKVSPHRSLNTRKGVAKFGRAATGMSNEEVRDALNSSPRNRDMPFVAEAYRVLANRNNGKQPTGTFFLSFQGTTLSKKIRLGFEQFDVYLYVPSPRRCLKCQKFGHNTRVCRAREEVCQTCATPGHSKDTCPNSDNPKCLNCKGSHTASDRDCPRFVAEKAALQIQAESHCPLVDARKKVEQTSATTNKEPDSASKIARNHQHTSQGQYIHATEVGSLWKETKQPREVQGSWCPPWHLHRRCPNQHSISCCCNSWGELPSCWTVPWPPCHRDCPPPYICRMFQQTHLYGQWRWRHPIPRRPTSKPSPCGGCQ